MRTAAEIRIEFMNKIGGLCSSNIEAAINTARREALEEAAKRAKITTQHKVSTHHVPYPVVDKQSILNLINELQ